MGRLHLAVGSSRAKDRCGPEAVVAVVAAQRDGCAQLCDGTPERSATGGASVGLQSRFTISLSDLTRTQSPALIVSGVRGTCARVGEIGHGKRTSKRAYTALGIALTAGKSVRPKRLAAKRASWTLGVISRVRPAAMALTSRSSTTLSMRVRGTKKNQSGMSRTEPQRTRPTATVSGDKSAMSLISRERRTANSEW